MILQETSRTKVELHDIDGQKTVQKTFKNIKPERFQQIIKAMLSCKKSGGVIPILSIGVDSQPSYLMPYCEQTLTKYIKEHPDQKDRVLEQLSRTLFELWNSGFIHNDVHGNNVLMDYSGNPMLIDFEHCSIRPNDVPFIHSPDLVGGGKTHAHWNKPGEVDLGVLIGGNNISVAKIADLVIRKAYNECSGPFWERVTKNQVYGTIDIPHFKIDGRRNASDRLDKFGIDLAGKTVLDLGCNTGHMCFEAMNRGATRVTGLEYIAPRAAAANLVSTFVGWGHKAQFHHCDFDVDDLSSHRSDITFAFAIDHQAKDAQKLYRNLYELTNETLLFETSRQPEFREWCKDQLLKVGFSSVDYIGESSSSDRKSRSRMDYIVRK